MFSKKVLAALLPAMLLTGCAAAPTTSASPTPPSATVCLVADSAGLTDNGVNESAYSALKEAVVSLGVDKRQKVMSAKSTPAELYAAINNMVRDDCKVIVGSGFNFRAGMSRAAKANPDLAFIHIDGGTAVLPAKTTSPNLKHITFDTAQSSILAGYLAAANSATGVVATFGSFDTPSVRSAMDGFAAGVELFNNDTDSGVLVLGAGEGGWKFLKNNSSKRLGKAQATRFFKAGADIVYPVASAAGSGAGLATLDFPNTYVIGSERDWYMDRDNYSWRSHILASTTKQVSRSVYSAISGYLRDGSFQAGEYLGNLDNGGVAITEERSIPYAPQYNSERARLTRSIISGETPTPRGN